MIKIQVIDARGTALRLDRFVGNLPRMTRNARYELAEKLRDYSIENIARTRRYPSRRGSQGLTNPATWFIVEEGRSINVIPAATAESKSGKSHYAVFVEKGTRPHEIPTNPLWGMRGRMHPGAFPNPFMGPALDRVKQEAGPTMDRHIRDGAMRSGFR